MDELSAVGLEQMIEALEVVNHKTDKQSMGAKAGMIEQHPEVGRNPARQAVDSTAQGVVVG